MNSRPWRLALHPWSLDTTPLADVLRVARATGWDAVELRHKNLEDAIAAVGSREQALDLVRTSELPVSAVGVETGWLFAQGEEQARLLASFAESCRVAAALDCDLVMSAIGPGQGTVAQAAASVRAAGDLAGEHGVRLALEFNAPHPQINSLERVNEVLAAADHPRCGLLLDAFHLHHSGRPGGGFADVPVEQILYVQYADTPGGLPAAAAGMQRLPPGQGVAQLREFFALLAEKGYAGDLSYEAPNPAAWARDPSEVAREALLATRALLPQ